MASLSACVINYRGGSRLGRTLDALRSSELPPEEILVVDSGSDDGSVRAVESEFPSVRVVELDENRGPAVARNRGFRAARYERVLFIDHDVIVEQRCIARLRAALAAHPEAVLALPRILWEHRPDVIQLDGAEPHYLGLMILRNAGATAHACDGSVVEVNSMASGCFLIDGARWGEDLPFDESFGFNYEDHDFGVRCRLRGNRIVSVPDARCFHGRGTVGFSVRKGVPYPPSRAYHLIRGRWVILLKSYQIRTLLLLTPILLIYEVFQLIFVIRKGWLGQWVRAVSWVVSNRNELGAKRRAVQNLRVLPDRELLRGGPIPLRPELTQGGPERIGFQLLQMLSDIYWRLVRPLL